MDGCARRPHVVDSIFGQYFTFTFSQPDDPTATDLEGIGGPGDSGGPAFIQRRGRLYVAGVSSLNHKGDAAGPARYRSTELYARVAPNAAWIDGVMAGRGTPDAVTDTVRTLAAAGWPATRAGETARRWLEMFNGQDSLEISRFEATFRADSMLARRSADARVATWRNLFADWGPLEAYGYVESPGKPLVLLVRSEKLDQWMSLTFRLEPAAPHKLVGLAIRRPEDAPADAVPRP